MSTHTELAKNLLMGSTLAMTLSAASPAVAEEYGADNRHTPTVVYEVEWISGTQETAAAAVEADLDYVTGMRKHHAGALTMSKEYLSNGDYPALRRMAEAIIANQRFEIAVLDEVKRRVEQPPAVLADFGGAKLVLRQVATDGLEHSLAFVKSPAPTVIDHWAADATVDEYDVRWAKAMIAHHQGALDMAEAYNADRDGRNSFLRLMNLDIVRDQTYEIGLLEGVVARYPGDASSVTLDPSMVHGMSMDGHTGNTDHDAMNH